MTPATIKEERSCQQLALKARKTGNGLCRLDH
ncbi:hypothetical protein V3C99_009459 [Haemonchus contortus]